MMDPYQNQARAHEQGLAEHGPSGQPPQAFTPPQHLDAADGRGEQQYAQRHEQHQQPQQQQHQALLAVAGQLAVLPKAQDVRVQCEASDCQSLLQVSIPITQQLRSPVIVRCGGCHRLLEVDLAAALLHLAPYLQQQQQAAAAAALPTPKAAATPNLTAEANPHHQQQGQFNLQATHYQPPPQYHQPHFLYHNVIPPPVHSQFLNADPHGTGSGSQNQYQPQPHANSIPPPVHTQQALPTPQSYRMVQQGSHSRPQAQAQSPHGAQHQFQVLPNLSSESLRGPSLSQPQGLTAEHCSTLALSPGDHPLQVSPAQQQAHPPGASPSPRYDEAVLTTPAHSQDSVPMHQIYGAGPSQPQGSADHFCQQPQAHHQASEGIRHRSPSLEPIPLPDAPRPQSVAPEGSNMLQPASVPPRIAQYHNQPYVQLNPQLQAPQAHQNQQLYPLSSYHAPAPYPPQGSYPQLYPQPAQPPQQLTNEPQYILTAQQPDQHQHYQQQFQLQHQQQQTHPVLHEQGTLSSASQGSRAVAGIQGGPAYAPGLMTADYSGGNSAGVSDEALGPGKKRKKGDEAQWVSDVHSLSLREEITRLKAQNPTMSHKEAFGIAADHWQYSPNNTGLAKKRRVKKAAAAEATSTAFSPTAHLNPSSLVSPTPLQPLVRPVSISHNSMAGRHLFSVSTASGLLPSSSSTTTAPPKLISDSALLDRLNALPQNGSQARALSAAGQAATGPIAEQAQIAEPAVTIEHLPSSTALSAAAEQEGVSFDLMQPAEAAVEPHAYQTNSGVPKANSAEPSQPAGLARLLMAAADTQLAPEPVLLQSSLTEAHSGGTEAAAVEASASPRPQPVHSPATTNTGAQSTGLMLNISTAGHAADGGGGPSASGLVDSSPIEQHGSLPTQPHVNEQPPADGRRIASTTAETPQRPHGLDDPVKGQGHAAAALAVHRHHESEPMRFSQERSPEPVGMDSMSGVHVTFPPVTSTRSSSVSPGSSISPQARHLSMPNPFSVSPELMCALSPDNSPASCRLASAPASNSPSTPVLLAPRSTSSEAQLLLAPHIASPQLLPAPTFRDGVSTITPASEATAGLNALLHAQHQQHVVIKQSLPLMNSEARDGSVSLDCSQDQS
ncbi:TPA: hypothetical protein ACH3X2_000071 [Trebouxia sp. C0005]